MYIIPKINAQKKMWRTAAGLLSVHGNILNPEYAKASQSKIALASLVGGAYSVSAVNHNKICELMVTDEDSRAGTDPEPVLGVTW